MDWRTDQLSRRDMYKLLVNTVLPRPIALVTTHSIAGLVNAAPFSFFNVLSDDPPLLALGLEGSNLSGDGLKDTARNIADTSVFVVNLVDEAMMPAMQVCAVDFAAEVDEVQLANLRLSPSEQVSAPRLVDAPVQFECRVYQTLEVGRHQRQIVLGEVVHLHIRDGIIDQQLHVDLDRLGTVARLHGSDWYMRMTDRFQVPRRTINEFK